MRPSQARLRYLLAPQLIDLPSMISPAGLEFSFKVGEFQVFVDVEETPHSKRWSQSLQSHRVPTTRGAYGLDLTIRQIEGWTNDREDEGFFIDPGDEDGLRHIVLNSPSIYGEIEDIRGYYRGEIKVNGDTSGPLETAVRSASSLLFEDHGQLLVHASAVIKDGEAWVFVGPSGSGKTTIVERLNDGGKPMGIDRVVLRYRSQEGLVALSTPFSDRKGCLEGPASAPVAAVCFIEQAEEHSVDNVSVFDSISTLATNTQAFSRDSERVLKTLDMLGIVAELGICTGLRFEKDEGFWPLLHDWKRKR